MIVFSYIFPNSNKGRHPEFISGSYVMTFCLSNTILSLKNLNK